MIERKDLYQAKEPRFVVSKILMILCLFFMGWVSNSLYLSIHTFGNPFTNTDNSAREVFSPSDIIELKDIKMTDNNVCIAVSKPTMTVFTPTKSMDPTLDDTMTAIEIEPKSISDVQVGDIISYRHEMGRIVHRVVKIDMDEEGWYAVTKGDNIPFKDPVRVRFDDIYGIVAVVIY